MFLQRTKQRIQFLGSFFQHTTVASQALKSNASGTVHYSPKASAHLAISYWQPRPKYAWDDNSSCLLVLPSGESNSSNAKRLCQRIQFLSRQIHLLPESVSCPLQLIRSMTQRSAQTCQHSPAQATAASPSMHLLSFWQHFYQGWKKGWHSASLPAPLPYKMKMEGRTSKMGSWLHG